MIRLTRLNQDPIIVNLHVIAYVESAPDTLVTLTNGDRVHVRETVEQVVDLAVAYERRVHAESVAVLPSDEGSGG